MSSSIGCYATQFFPVARVVVPVEKGLLYRQKMNMMRHPHLPCICRKRKWPCTSML